MNNDCNTNIPFSDTIRPRNLNAVTVSPSEIEVSWSPPVDMDSVIEYVLYYHSADASHTKTHILDPLVTKYKLTGLIPDTLYRIELTAISSLDEERSFIQERTHEFSNNTYFYCFVSMVKLWFLEFIFVITIKLKYMCPFSLKYRMCFEVLYYLYYLTNYSQMQT